MNAAKLKLIFAIASAITVVVLVAIQIATAETSTKTETALFSVLQFIFSIAVSWLLAQLSSEKQFLESQKKFAIAAFRRIKEIERAISRAQRLVLSPKGSSTLGGATAHQAVMVSLISAQDAVNSSIADWGDVIGDEIHITNEIEKLRALRKSSDKFERDYLDNLRRSDSNTEDITPKIVKLKEALPPSLQLEEEGDDEKLTELSTRLLDRLLKEDGALSFDCFWEPDDSFAGDPSGLKEGDTIYIARGYTTGRPNSLLAYRKDGKWIGVVTNIFIDHGIDIDYDRFVDTIEMYLSLNLVPPQFGGTMIPVTLTEIGDKDKEHGVQHFTILLDKATIDAQHAPNIALQETLRLSASRP